MHENVFAFYSCICTKALFYVDILIYFLQILWNVFLLVFLFDWKMCAYQLFWDFELAYKKCTAFCLLSYLLKCVCILYQSHEFNANSTDFYSFIHFYFFPTNVPDLGRVEGSKTCSTPPHTLCVCSKPWTCSPVCSLVWVLPIIEDRLLTCRS